jgi:DNA-binding transcriptional regulator YiaG
MNGAEIRKLRKKLKMSRRKFGIEIGKVLNQKPIIHTTIYRWEAGWCKPRPNFIKALNTIKKEYMKNHIRKNTYSE